MSILVVGVEIEMLMASILSENYDSIRDFIDELIFRHQAVHVDSTLTFVNRVEVELDPHLGFWGQ
jgi:hypothetical protein